MGRVGDKGDYAMGNCRFILREQNIEEWKTNGGMAAMRLSKTGRTKETDSGIASMARKMVLINSKDYEVISPDGESIRGTNLKLLCEAKGLSNAAMSLVLNGHRMHHKGWTGHYIEGEDL